jgi:hypothetical protein
MMKRSTHRFYLGMAFALSCLTFLIACSQETPPTIDVRGIYGNPQALWDKGYQLNELGINAIFVRSGAIHHDLLKRARSEGLQVYAEFATLNGKNYVDKHPEAWAINEKGEKVQAASWFMGVCPTEPGFRQYRHDQLRDLLTKFDLDGVFMDYVHWHAQFEEPEPILVETCFCDHCLQTFSDAIDITLPDGSTPEKAEWILSTHDVAWRNWRCQVIYDWSLDLKQIIQELRPDALLGLYHCPWTDQEFDSARYRILGLDYDLLKESIDVFSPMVYHMRMGREPAWVKENLRWFSQRLKLQKAAFPKVWPIVQAYNNPGVVSPEEFETILRYGMEAPASGVMMFTTNAVADDPGKIEVLKKVYKTP